MNYKIPSSLLTTKSYKTLKGEEKGYTTYIMYLSPFKQNDKGINLCSHASEGCAAACLFNSGNARFNKIQKGRINKSNFFLANRQAFLKMLYIEIAQIEIKHKIEGTKFAIRLNGTSDIRFEKFKIVDNKNIFELFPDIQFYDYTKNHLRFKYDIPSNYHITFSRSETNDNVLHSVLEKGINVAVVFDKLPKTYLGREVINGDNDDLRFLDKKGGYIVGLTYKRASVKGGAIINEEAFKSGFAINIEEKKTVNV